MFENFDDLLSSSESFNDYRVAINSCTAKEIKTWVEYDAYKEDGLLFFKSIDQALAHYCRFNSSGIAGIQPNCIEGAIDPCGRVFFKVDFSTKDSCFATPANWYEILMAEFWFKAEDCCQ